jgi:hypothetical protein
MLLTCMYSSIVLKQRYKNNSNITSFIGYINDEMIKLTIYFNSQKRIDEHITNIIPYWMHVFVQDRGAYKHKNVRNVFTYIFSE